MDPALKQRLIGAVVLVVLAVIFVPMMIGGAPKTEQQAVDLTIPKAPERNFETRVVPLAPGAAPAPAAAPAKPAATPDNSMPTTAARTDAPVAVVDTHAPPKTDALAGDAARPAASGTIPSTPARPAPASPAQQSKDAGAAAAAATAAAANTATGAAPPAPINPPPTGGGRYVVSFGTYAKKENVDALVASLVKAGLKAYSDNVDVNGEPRFRVRSGPYVDRSEAEAARLKGKAARADAPGTIVEVDDSPARPAVASAKPAAASPAAAGTPAAPPATAAATPAPRVSGWAVQVGAFATEAEANLKRDQLRNAGFASFIDPVKTEKATLYRVRVGPEAVRANADKLRDALKAKFGGDAIVVSHP